MTLLSGRYSPISRATSTETSRGISSRLFIRNLSSSFCSLTEKKNKSNRCDEESTNCENLVVKVTCQKQKDEQHFDKCRLSTVTMVTENRINPFYFNTSAAVTMATAGLNVIKFYCRKRKTVLLLHFVFYGFPEH